jgi:hypothetical protein
VKLHSIFLRNGCILPERLNPLRESYGRNWMVVKETTASVFDTMIRHAGWHFIWMSGSCSRRGFGRTREEAIDRALVRALSAVNKQCNAAELDSVHVAKYPGLSVAMVTVQRHRIQQNTMLDIADTGRPRADPAK